MSAPIDRLTDAAVQRQAQLLTLTAPADLRAGRVGFQFNGAYLGVVDDCDEGGPVAFDGAKLRELIERALVIVASTDFCEQSATCAAALMSNSAAGRVVVIATGERQHAAWTSAVLAITGAAPVLHVTDIAPQDVGAPAVGVEELARRTLH